MTKKRQIDFTGPSIKDLGIEIDKNGNTRNTITNIGNANNNTTKQTTKKGKITPKGVKTNNGITKLGNTNNSNTKNGITKTTYNTVQFHMVRDALYRALGLSDRVEIKLSAICEELRINPKTFYKHLKTLRETEFIITKLQYSTEIRKREAGE